MLEFVTLFLGLVAGDLQRAARGLGKTLERQRIVWLDGAHLPHRVEAGPGAKARPATGSG